MEKPESALPISDNFVITAIFLMSPCIEEKETNFSAPITASSIFKLNSKLKLQNLRKKRFCNFNF